MNRVDQIEDKYILEQILKAGIIVDNVYDLVNTSESYTELIPTLVSLLKEGIKDDILLEGVVRALAVKEAKGHAKLIVNLYKQTPLEKHSLRWAMANTINAILTKDVWDDVIELVRNQNNGKSRQMLVSALGRIKSEESENALIEIIEQDGVTLHVLGSLGRLKSQKATLEIRKFLNSPKKAVQREAEKVLKKIG